jgi:hypothetical protein
MKAVGYGRLVEKFSLDVLELQVRSFIHEKSLRRSVENGAMREFYYPVSYDPGDAWQDNLVFALKYEGVQLEVLAALFVVIGPNEVRDFIAAAHLGKYSRQTWFLYEFLMNERLDLPDLDRGNYIPILDEAQVLSCLDRTQALRVKRQRILNNLPGPREYCPIIRRTKVLDSFDLIAVKERIAKRLGSYPARIVERAARYLYSKETKSSFEIEQENPNERRVNRFIELLRQAGGDDPYSEADLVRLEQAIVEERYASSGFRKTQNYVGESLGPTREWVHYVPPKPADLSSLMEGWTVSCRRLRVSETKILALATIAGFGFVFLHPFEDGNGRLHRFLIHDALVACGFTPRSLIFPVSAVMLRRLKDYDAALEAYSKPLMEHLTYTLSDRGELSVQGDTQPLYRYPDLTAQAEALAGFIEETVDTELAAELEYLALFDAARERVRSLLDMPDKRLDLFVSLCIQGKGRLSHAKRSRFPELRDEELATLEQVVAAEMERPPLSNSILN